MHSRTMKHSLSLGVSESRAQHKDLDAGHLLVSGGEKGSSGKGGE